MYLTKYMNSGKNLKILMPGDYTNIAVGTLYRNHKHQIWEFNSIAHPQKYIHIPRFVLCCLGAIPVQFTHIIQGYFTGNAGGTTLNNWDKYATWTYRDIYNQNKEQQNSMYIWDLSHNSHNASNKYPTMHHFVTEMCTHVHISVTKWCIVEYGTDALWDMGLVNCGICATGLLDVL